ncbi:hypothetical protein BH11ACT4_BH11ACT4_07790 [soil metagenome]
MIRHLALAGALVFAPLVAAAIASPAAASPAATASTCTVSDGTIGWGLKESFRSYISGSIANGKWTVADGATYSTPDFGFTGGAGTLDAGSGTIAFPGSIEFTGHGGILDTTVANPQLRFDRPGTATLLLDVTGTTQQGDPVDAKAVEFATIKTDAAVIDGGRYRLDAAATTLTAAGAAAFGTYTAGTALDPITVDFAASPECAPQRSAGPTIVLVVVGAGIALLVGLLVLGAVITVVLLVRRSRRQR